MNKAAFLDTMRAERERWEALLAEVGEPRMERPGVAGDWSVRDIVAHVTAYERGLVEWLEAASRGECLSFPDLDHPDVDYRNAAILRENEGRPLEDILLESRRVFQRLLQRGASVVGGGVGRPGADGVVRDAAVEGGATPLEVHR